jgi:hypothetical protein
LNSACARLNVDGSACLNPGVWQPMFLLYAPGAHSGCAPARVLLGLRICEMHKQVSMLSDFLSEEGWVRIQIGFRKANRIEPDRARTQLAWQRYSDIQEELRKLRVKEPHFTMRGPNFG